MEKWDKDHAKKQVGRLAQMLGFPNTTEAIGELVLAVQSARDEKQAAAVISAILETATTATRCPMPAQIREAIYERRSAADTESRTRTANCIFCNGTGQEIVERGGLTGAKTCRCRLAAVSNYPD